MSQEQKKIFYSATHSTQQNSFAIRACRLQIAKEFPKHLSAGPFQRGNLSFLIGKRAFLKKCEGVLYCFCKNMQKLLNIHHGSESAIMANSTWKQLLATFLKNTSLQPSNTKSGTKSMYSVDVGLLQAQFNHLNEPKLMSTQKKYCTQLLLMFFSSHTSR